ncbi:hypothetical protein MRX96_054965 [Rhipicephalus microplus]
MVSCEDGNRFVQGFDVRNLGQTSNYVSFNIRHSGRPRTSSYQQLPLVHLWISSQLPCAAACDFRPRGEPAQSQPGSAYLRFLERTVGSICDDRLGTRPLPERPFLVVQLSDRVTMVASVTEALQVRLAAWRCALLQHSQHFVSVTRIGECELPNQTLLICLYLRGSRGPLPLRKRVWSNFVSSAGPSKTHLPKPTEEPSSVSERVAVYHRCSINTSVSSVCVGRASHVAGNSVVNADRLRTAYSIWSHGSATTTPDSRKESHGGHSEGPAGGSRLDGHWE